MNAGGDPTQITLGLNNNLWVTEPAVNSLGIFDTTTRTASSPLGLVLVNASPPGITATGGSSGTIWFSIASAVSNFQLGQLTQANPTTPPPAQAYCSYS